MGHGVIGVRCPVAESGPQPAVRRAGKPAVRTAASLRNLTEKLHAQFGHTSCVGKAVAERRHWSALADLDPTMDSKENLLLLEGNSAF
jgi:hypothetical protein